MLVLALLALIICSKTNSLYSNKCQRTNLIRSRCRLTVHAFRNFNPTRTITKCLLSSQEIQEIHQKTKNSQAKERNGIVIIAGFEQFNIGLYKDAAQLITDANPSSPVSAFTDEDLLRNADAVSAALASAKVVFISLVFDFNQVQYLQSQLQEIPVRFCFESALELMSTTQVGSFTMNGGGAGPPAPVKALLKQFGSAREEDKMAGYVNFLKVGPKLLKWVPGLTRGSKLYDVRVWLTVYAYWSQGGLENVCNMLRYINQEFPTALDAPTASTVAEVVEQPTVGLFHPDHEGFFATPESYIKWYESSHPGITELTPRVGVLLYRKHVLTQQGYIPNLIKLMESEGLVPVPVFINGVEGHTVVRDLLTSRYESDRSALSEGATSVDAIVNTIGFPLVGGPAGSMEGGRGIEASREILTAKNIPYIVAAPLIIQDVENWEKNGVQGLQTIVLFALPELDGAIEPVVLGGLVGGDRIIVVPERVRRLTGRIKSHIALRMASPSDRRINLLVYGFPPNVGAVGTAALLNVGNSLTNLFARLQREGYDLGDGVGPSGAIDGEELVKALKILAVEATASSVKRAQQELRRAGLPFSVVGREVPYTELRSFLGKSMTAKMEAMWGSLEEYTGLGANKAGRFLCLGLQLGNVFVGIQPLVGVEGDPMRLLFSRDLTPHPQYAAFYQYLQEKDRDSSNDKRFPSALCHFGMHGTVEWLPGSQLGNTADSWSDKLLGDDVNVYLYAANNPSESVLAKRRGYATIVSHNVPPYSRAGLYKELVTLKETLREYRTAPSVEAIPVLANLVEKMGLYDDVPFSPSQPVLTMERADQLLLGVAAENERTKSVGGSSSLQTEFDRFAERLFTYLLELENRLFSEGLHTVGGGMDAAALYGYLEGIHGAELDSSVLKEVASRVIEGQSLSTTLIGLQSMKQRDAASHVSLGHRNEFWGLQIQSPQELNPNPQTGVDWADAFSPDVLFALRLILAGSVLEGLEILWYKFQSALGSPDAEAKVADILVLNSLPSVRGVGGVGTGGQTSRGELVEAIKTAILLASNPATELDGLVAALGGEYVAAAPGGDIIRDGRGVLPTGRNIHALDPYRIPSALALARGSKAAKGVLDQQLKLSGGVYPETVAVTLWGLDCIKTKGESVAIVLALIGAKPVYESTGRIVKFDLIPLAELGRPRIDVLCSLSGIFRDSFGNLLELLDDLFIRAAQADEPADLNFVRKHSASFEAKGLEGSTARLFSNPSGDFGSLVGEQVGSGNWADSRELGATWEGRNSFSYGLSDKGKARPDILRSLLNTTDRIVQEVDCVEYGLTDIQEYFGNTGGLIRAAENNRADSDAMDEATGGGSPKRKRAKVGVSIIEAFEKDVKPRELEETLRVEYRSKLLNPSWAAAMMKQGAGGAYEISGRMTAMVGWAGTTGFSEKWVWDGAAERYALDPVMAEKLKEANPEAFRNIIKRMLEANGRGMWRPNEGVLEKLMELYSDAEDEVEGV